MSSFLKGIFGNRGEENRPDTLTSRTNERQPPNALVNQRNGPNAGDGCINRVQVGCGPHNLMDDWWNVDIRNFRGIDEVMDVTSPWPWKDCLDYVYGEHFIEHIGLDQAVKFLEFAGKALKVGGKIRLSTPSLEWVLKTHFDFQNSDLEPRLCETFNTNRAFHGWGHQFLYSKEMLGFLLESVGFQDIVWKDYGESADANLHGLERHGGFSFAHGYPSVWIVEATRKNQEISMKPEVIERINQDYLRFVQSGH